MPAKRNADCGDHSKKGEKMDANRLVLESALKQASRLVKGSLKIESDPPKRLALKAALRYLKLAGSPKEAPAK